MPDPAIITIATAMATNAVQKISDSAAEGTIAAFKTLCEKVFTRFRSIPEAQDALDAARIDESDTASLTTLAAALDKAAQDDPEIGRLLDELLQVVSEDGAGTVHNTIHGDVSGHAKVIQTRDIHGDVHL